MMKRYLISAILVLAMVAGHAQESVPEYEKIFKEGIEAFDVRDYKTALLRFKRVINMPETSPILRDRAAKFIQTCEKNIKPGTASSSVRQAKPAEVRRVLNLSPMNLSLSAAGGSKEITVESDSGWEIKEKPQWCKVMETTDAYLKIWCDENAYPAAREGELVISAAGGRILKNVHIFQEKGAGTGQVYFRTDPGNALIEIHDSGIYGISSHAHKLTAGKHNVRVLKEGYETLDTTIVVPVDEVGKTTVIDLALEPEFGVLVPEMIFDEIAGEEPELSFRVNRKPIDLSEKSGGLSFDDAGGVIYNTLYKGGRIPLLPGIYEVSATAEGFEDFRTYVTVNKGETHSLACEMKCTSGWMTVVDDGNAEGAEVIVEEAGIVGKLGERMRIPVGEYLVEVRKNGYMLDDGILEVKIEKDKDMLYKARMTRMVNCMVSTNVQGETVLVDGEKVPYQQPRHVIPMAEGKSYALEVQKEGYWPYRDTLTVTAADTLINLEGLKLRKTMPLHIDYDEPSIRISLYAKGDSLKRDYAGVIPYVSTDTTLNVPYGKYQVRLTRRYELIKGRKTAYKGTIDFNEEKDRFRIQTWSRANFLVLGGDYGLLFKDFSQSEPLRMSGSAFFGQFKMWNGLSTSILKAAAFNVAEKQFPFKDENAVQPEWLFGGSCLFLNYDFRMGGGFCQYGDANLLLSYSWYPPLTILLPMSHFSGHEAFAGIEVSSRIPFVNINMRLGVQYLNGRSNCYNVPSERYTETKDCFTEAPYNHLALVASVGFSLGGRDAKGRNVLRLW